MKRSIFSKQYLVVLFLSVPLTLAIFVISYSVYKGIQSRNKLNRNIAMVTSRNVLDKIDRNFYERFGDVQAFAFNRLAVEAVKMDSTTEPLQQFINTMTSYYVLYDLMMVCDKDGKVLTVNSIDKMGKDVHSGFVVGKNMAEEPWFKTCMSSIGPEGGAWYSDYAVNRDVKAIDNDNAIGWGMAFAAPIKDETGAAIGVWYNFASWYEVTVKIRQQVEAELRSGKEGAIVIITTEKGVVIDAEDSSKVMNETVVNEASLKENTQIQWKGAFLVPSDYEWAWASAGGAYTYKGKNWKAVVLIPKEKFTLASILSGEMLTLYLIVSIFLGVSTLLAFQFSTKITTGLNALRIVVDKISEGDLTTSNLNSEGEIGEMEGAINSLALSLKEKVQFAENIGKGNLDAEYVPVGEKDVLGVSLVNMRMSLAAAAEEDNRRNWITEGLAQFAGLLRSHTDTQKLYDEVMLNLVYYMGANQGGMFVLVQEQGEEPLLEMVACYAYQRKKYIGKKIYLGEGLAGQAVLEKDYVYLSEVPENYVTIASGLGDARPRSILVMPLMANEEVLGVVELAFFKLLESHQIEFLKKVSENIASVITSARINVTTSKLLKDAQEMTEALRSQEEEMRQNMEELQATQEEMQRKTIELERVGEMQAATYEKEIAEYKKRLDKLTENVPMR
jgi:methyl-accepting chemotaxis protein